MPKCGYVVSLPGLRNVCDFLYIETCGGAGAPEPGLASGADVRHSIIDGALVMKDRELLTLDVHRIRREAELLLEKNPWLCRW